MAVTAKDVQELRARTGAGMMDCKNALVETDGDMDAAVELLRKKGVATAAKKAGRVASQGIVDSYIHMGGKIGVLVEVNCETDFVAKGDLFRNFVHDVALQIAAARPTYVSKDEVPASEIEHEKEILKAQIANDPAMSKKPAAIIEKMVEGRISKFYTENCLLEQPFVKNPEQVIADLVVETTAKCGEKISIRRFVRYEMGEGLEKKADTFADEINATLEKMKI